MRGLSKLLLVTFALSLPAHAWAKQPDGEPSGSPDDSGESIDGEPIEDDDAGDETPDSEVPAEEPVAEENAAEDLQSLRSEYFKLRDKLFQSRARASAVASALYSTRLSVGLNYTSARYYTITRATIRLDGANIYDDSEGSISSDTAPRFEGYISPGRHQLSIRLEATGKDDQRFTSIIDNSFVVQAVQGKDLSVRIKAQDGGDIAYKWKKKEQGSYQLHLDVSVKSKKRSDSKSDHVKRTGELRKNAPAKTHKS
tara:strand:+ start:62186 stop:62950 length:765 start_codon:yes stop_codon:yes gene_type:complete